MALTRMLPSPVLPSQRMARFPSGPRAGRYLAAAAMVTLFLTPYLVLSSALQPVTPIIAAQLHMSLQAVNLTSGLANAGYAAGTVLAVQFSQLLPQRRMLLVYGTPGGAVSVVGDFNGWDPFAHPLRRRTNGTRSATLTAPAGRTLHFRYLCEGGIWFDDDAVPHKDAQGGCVTV